MCKTFFGSVKASAFSHVAGEETTDLLVGGGGFGVAAHEGLVAAQADQAGGLAVGKHRHAAAVAVGADAEVVAADADLVLVVYATEIAKLIIEAGLWQSGGKTPDATVSARLYSDIKNNGDKSFFVKVGPQTFALRDSAEIPNSAVPVPAPVEEALKPSTANTELRDRKSVV